MTSRDPCPPRSDPGYHRVYFCLRYRADPAYRARHLAKSRRRTEQVAAENAAGRAWRARSVAGCLARLAAAGWSYARIGAALGVGKQAVYCWAAGRRLPGEANAAALSRLADDVAGADDGEGGTG